MTNKTLPLTNEELPGFIAGAISLGYEIYSDSGCRPDPSDTLMHYAEEYQVSLTKAQEKEVTRAIRHEFRGY